ncbi:hypothetical protein QL285_070600 [Trifolium repens]|nr:hypothetical protein QL285_070600 [Trifolium repens]
MDKVLQMLAIHNQPPPPAMNEKTMTTEPTNVVWLSFGLPLGYTPPGYVPFANGVSFVLPPVNNTENQVGATLVQSVNVPSQEVPEDLKDAYQGPEFVPGEPRFDFAIPHPGGSKTKIQGY